jgi:hypothetical protein
MCKQDLSMSQRPLPVFHDNSGQPKGNGGSYPRIAERVSKSAGEAAVGNSRRDRLRKHPSLGQI